MSNKFYKLKLINYNLIYNIDMPTKITDYDYDDAIPERRFITTLLHNLSFYDNITGVKVLNLKFSTDTCYKLKYGLLQLLQNEKQTNNKILLLTLKNVYSNDMMTPSIISLFKLPNNFIQISVLNNIDNNVITFSEYEVHKLIKLLSYEI